MMIKKRPFRFGVTAIEGAASREEWRTKARRIEDAGYATLVIPDHFACQFSPIPALLSAADATSALRVGSFVFDNDFRHPAVLAKDIATLDVLSDGRFELGMGAGWYRGEYEQAGIPFDPLATRHSRLEEAIRVMKRLFSAEPVTFSGRFYRLKDHDGRPKPVQRPHPPLLVGGAGKRMLSIAAREADIIGIHFFVDDVEDRMESALARRVGWIREAAEERFEQLELNIFIQRVEVTAEPYKVVEAMIQKNGWAGVTGEQVLDMPYYLIGSADHIIEKLQVLRERYHISYFVVADDRDQEAFAPIVARLAGM
ncbi:MAG TPA: TIGR03621 family F420-dependent LLM class oxidoreductase [Ktedonobacteraceae bacterium]